MPLKPAGLTREELAEKDTLDPLGAYRARFALPEGVIYLDGNSLGAMPRATPRRIADVLEQEWAVGLVRSWNTAGWIDLGARVGDKIARLIGAVSDSVVVADSTSINLFKLLAGALSLRPGRQVILSETGNFPSDLYVAQGLRDLLQRGHRLHTVGAGQILDHLDENVAVVMLTQVNYHTGQRLDMAAITRAAHRVGALVIWDLAHSAGAMPIDLTADEVDFAVGCGYKYLNGGPGAPAFLYIAPRLQDAFCTPVAGWLGHAQPFAFEADYRPAKGIRRAIVGTPPILSLAALEVGVDLALEVDLRSVREKSTAQTRVLADLIEQRCQGYGLQRSSPRDPELGGSQVCFTHPHAYAIMQALIAHGVIGDFRAPDVLRFGITPLYLSYGDLWDAVSVLEQILREDIWRAREYQVRQAVT